MRTLLILGFCIFCASGASTKLQIENSKTRIIEGEDGYIEDFPWLVYVTVTRTNNKLLRCGGSLITKKIILTAAHCLLDYKDGYGSLGSTYQDEGTIIYFEEIKIHEGYNYPVTKHLHDIGLILLEEEADLENKNIALLKLYNQPNIPDNYPAIVAGWGIIANNKTKPDGLQYVPATIINNSECKKIATTVLDSEICTIGEGLQSACRGDSGGPLVIGWPDDNIYQVGIVSHGKTTDCEKGNPVMYTRVLHYKKWINENVKKLLQ